MTSISVVNDVKIIDDGNGNMHFEPVEHEEKQTEQSEECSVFQKLFNWWKSSPIVPYMKRRDLSDPFDDRNTDGGHKNAIEVGVKLKF